MKSYEELRLVKCVVLVHPAVNTSLVDLISKGKVINTRFVTACGWKAPSGTNINFIETSQVNIFALQVELFSDLCSYW